MSAHHDELRARLSRGDDIELTAVWSIEQLATDPTIGLRYLSELEWRFWRDIVESYERWRKARLN